MRLYYRLLYSFYIKNHFSHQRLLVTWPFGSYINRFSFFHENCNHNFSELTYYQHFYLSSLDIFMGLLNEIRDSIQIHIKPLPNIKFKSWKRSSVQITHCILSRIFGSDRSPRRGQGNVHGVLWALSLFSKIRPWAYNSHINLKYFAGRY